MKTRSWAVLIGAAVLIALLMWWRGGLRVATSTSSIPKPVANQTSSTPAGEKRAAVASKDSNATQKPLTSKREQIQDVLSKFNDKDIEFYGKVVDQFAEPIPGVSVKGSVIYNNGVASGVQEKHTTTDSQGLFSFSGMKGRTFDYHLEKAGYQTMPERDAFDYTELVPQEKRFHPDPHSPVVLKMWKLQGAEPLIHYERDFKLPPDGTPVRIDLMTGNIVPQGGDLVLTLKHEIWTPGMQGKRPFNWMFQMSAESGGLVASSQKLMYLAPEEGYEPTIVVNMPADKKPWGATVDGAFYLRSRGQINSRVAVHINANPDQERGSYLSLTWWLNPKPGSRNLEFDPAKLAKP